MIAWRAIFRRKPATPNLILGPVAITPIYYRELIVDTGSPDAVAGYLIFYEVLGNLFKHTVVSLPLTVSGIFPGRCWGLLGFVCLIVTTVALLQRGHWLWLMFAAPGLFMAAFYAGISVSIPC